MKKTDSITDSQEKHLAAKCAQGVVKVVAGDGIEPPTQGFSGTSDPLSISPTRSHALNCNGLPPQESATIRQNCTGTDSGTDYGKPRLLDLFCGVGGWSKAFMRRGWHCVGVDILDLGYPGEFLQCSVLDLTPEFIDSFDAIASSPPCEEFARAWLPWLRGDKTPEKWAVDLLEWSVKLCTEPHHGTASRNAAGLPRITCRARHCTEVMRFGVMSRCSCRSCPVAKWPKAECGPISALKSLMRSRTGLPRILRAT